MPQPALPSTEAYASPVGSIAAIQLQRGARDRYGATPAERTAKNNFFVLQAFRGMAALAVVAFHINESVFGIAKYWEDHPFGKFLDAGHAGVEFFFVLSGFIILTAHRKDIGNASRLRSYSWKRFRRIYPVYWVVLAAVAPVFFLNPSFGIGYETNISTLIDSLLLVHVSGQDGQVVGVAWTLFHEVLFYAFFGLAILNARFGAAMLALWTMGSLATLVWPTTLPFGLRFYLSPLHVLFAMGMIAAWAVERRLVKAPLLQLIFGTLLFAGVGAADVNSLLPPLTLSLLYGLASAAMVAGGVELEQSGRLTLPSVLVLLGNASYSIYLAHSFALSVVAKILVRLDDRLTIPHELIFVLLFVSGTATGLLFYALVEVRLLAWLRR